MFGYAGKILNVNLSSRTVQELETSAYANRFIGGRGIAARLYWDEAPIQVGAFDETNPLIFATGPMAGVPVIGGSRWIVCGKSPVTSPEHFCSSNLGGSWGLKLKSAGYDVMLVRGKCEKPAYLFIHNGICEFRDASDLWGKGAIETRETLKSDLGNLASVVTIGPAGENMATMATLLADDDASGSAGLGAVMGAKSLKAIVVAGALKEVEVANSNELRKLITYFRSFGKEPVMKAGSMPMRITGPGTKKAPCHGCIGTCLRRTYQAKDGQKGKFMCQASRVYQPYAEAIYGKDHDVPFQATKLCDNYGLDTMALSTILVWLYMCSRVGILTGQNTGIPLSKLGSLEFFETLVRKISLREGFGDMLAQGVMKAAEFVGPAAVEQLVPYLSKAGQPNVYDARLYINTALLHATDPKPPSAQLQEVTRIIYKWLEWRKMEPHSYVSNSVARSIAKRFWGGEAAADFSTVKGKALAAKMIQDRQSAKECLILCSFLWPIMDSEFTDDHVGDSGLEARLLSAVIGKDVDESQLNRIGERVFNLQRAIYTREGHRGTEDDQLPESWYTIPATSDMPNPEMLVPGERDESVLRKGGLVDRCQFEEMKREYYRLRHWDEQTGLQTPGILTELQLKDVA